MDCLYKGNPLPCLLRTDWLNGLSSYAAQREVKEFPMSPAEVSALAQALRQSGQSREALKPSATAIANCLEGLLGSKRFSFPRFMAEALGPVQPAKPPPPSVKRSDDITALSPSRSARLFRSHETPEALGL